MLCTAGNGVCGAKDIGRQAERPGRCGVTVACSCAGRPWAGVCPEGPCWLAAHCCSVRDPLEWGWIRLCRQHCSSV